MKIGIRMGSNASRGRLTKLVIVLALAMLAALVAPNPSGAQGAEPKDADTEDGVDTRPLTEPTPVDIGSRTVIPEPANENADEGGAFYVQFDKALSTDERAELADAGVSIGQAVAGSTYLARIPAGAAESITGQAGFIGLAEAEPDDALSPVLRSGGIPAHAVVGGGIAGSVEFYPDVSLAEALAAADAAGVVVPDRGSYLVGNRLKIEGSLAGFEALAAFDGVLYMSEADPPNETYNAVAQGVHRVGTIQGLGYDGSGVLLGIWDEGPVLSTHENLIGRINNNETAQPVNDHATHVAGTMIGAGLPLPPFFVGAAAEGMAPNVPLLQSYDFNGDVPTEMTTARTTQNIVATNNSFGSPAGRTCDSLGNCWPNWVGESSFGRYTSSARDWDNMVLSTGLITVKAAGNDRNNCGAQAADPDNCDGTLAADGVYYDNIASYGNAKNIITVGAINDDGTTITAFSSAGPADDGRIKPDIVANGAGLFSTCSAGPTDYCSKSGTSMASPVVTGIVAQMHEAYTSIFGVDLKADLAKAALVNSAVDLGRPGPDYLYGYGRVDAIDTFSVLNDAGSHELGSVSEGEDDIYTITAPGGKDLRVTLTWLDAAGVPNNASNDIVHDLDLMLVSPNGTKHYPWTGPGLATPANNSTRTGPNAIDTVEQVDVEAAVAGVWHVRVTGTSVATGPQDYALVSAPDKSQDPSVDQPLVTCSAPSNDNFASPNVLSGSTSPLTETILNSCATGETGELTHDPTSPVPGSPFSSLWWEWTAPADGPVTVDTDGTQFGLDTVMGVYTGTDVAALTVIGQDDDGLFANFGSKIDFTATAGTTYMIAVDGLDQDELGGVKVNVTFTCTPPGNDSFATPSALTGGSATDTVINTCATGEAGELTHDPLFPVPGSPFHSLWWEWTAPFTGPATVDTAGTDSGLDTVLGVYTGSSVGSLSPIGQDDDGLPGSLSKVDFMATAGTTYKIAVDGHYTYSIGNVTVNVSQACAPLAPNDDFANAATLTGSADSGTAFNTCATPEPGEATHDPNPFGGGPFVSLWWQWTAPANGPVTIDTEGSNLASGNDTVLGVYTGTDVAALTFVAGDDQGGTDNLSSLTFVAAAGTVYKIAVDSWDGNDFGDVVVNVEQADQLVVVSPGCGLYDSLMAADPILPGNGTPRRVQVVGACGVPVTASAVVLTVTSKQPSGVGNLRVSEELVAPSGGVVNYTTNGLDQTNTVTVPLSPGGAVDVAANNGDSHIRMVVVGFYAPSGDLTYTGVAPCAVADSRSGTVGFAGPFGAGAAMDDVDVVGTFPVGQGGGNTDCLVPASASHVVVNIVSIGGTGTGGIAAGVGGSTPAETTVNYAPIGLNNAAVAYLPVDINGKIAVDVLGSGNTHIRLVVLGYLELGGAGASYTSVNPCAAFDSRDTLGGDTNPATGSFAGKRLGGNSLADSSPGTTKYNMTGAIPAAQGGELTCGVPEGASAVLVNLVAITPDAVGNFRAYATGSSPTGGVLNFSSLLPPVNNANAVVVPLDGNGDIDLFVNAPSNVGNPTVHARGVIVGYYD